MLEMLLQVFQLFLQGPLLFLLASELTLLILEFLLQERTVLFVIAISVDNPFLIDRFPTGRNLHES